MTLKLRGVPDAITEIGRPLSHKKLGIDDDKIHGRHFFISHNSVDRL